MNESDAVTRLQNARKEIAHWEESLDELRQQAARDFASKLIEDAAKLLAQWKTKLNGWSELKRGMAPLLNPPKGAAAPGAKFKQEGEALVKAVNQSLDAMRELSKSTRATVNCHANVSNLASAFDIPAELLKTFAAWIQKAEEMEASRVAARKKIEEEKDKKKDEPKEAKPEPRAPGKPKTEEFSCAIDCRALKSKYPKVFEGEHYSAQVKFVFKTPIQRAPQLGRVSLGDAYITCVSGQQTIGYEEGSEKTGLGGPVKRGDVHNHFILQNVEGAGVYIVRDESRRDVAKIDCTMWDLGDTFGRKIASILQKYEVKSKP